MDHEARQAGRSTSHLLASANRILALVSDSFDLERAEQALSPVFVHAAILEAQTLISEAEQEIRPLELPLVAARATSSSKAEMSPAEVKTAAFEQDAEQEDSSTPMPFHFLAPMAANPTELSAAISSEATASNYEQFAQRFVSEGPVKREGDQESAGERAKEALAENYRRRTQR